MKNCQNIAHEDTITISWGIEDVRGERPDLTPEQCREVLHQCKRKHDANIGICWDVIRCHAEELFPEPENEKER